MKRIMFFAAVAALVSFISCTRIEEANDNSVKINISVSDPALATKAVKTGWESGDKINIWFDSNVSANPDLVLLFNGTKWTAGTMDESVVAALKTDGTGQLYGIFEGYNDLSKYSTEDYYSSKRFIAPVAPEAEAACGYPVYCTPLMVFSGAIAYTFDSETKVLTATMDDWSFGGDLQIVVTGLTGDPSDYGLMMGDQDEWVRFGFSRGKNISTNFKYPSTSSSNTKIYTGGVANDDGVAFYFAAANGLKRSRSMTLYDFKNDKCIGEYGTGSFEVSPDHIFSGKVSVTKFSGVDAGETMQKLRDDLVEFAPNVPNNSYGEVKTYQYYSKSAGHDKKVRVILPPNYDTNKKYPVLFVLHGIFGDENSMLDEAMGVKKMIANAISEGLTKDMIVIFPQMYTSPKGEQPSGFAFDQETMRYYDMFENDLLEDLLPWAKQQFSIAEGPKNTAITGFSLGGREALYIGTQHTDVFGFVGAACPAPGIVPTQDQFMAHEGTIKNEADFHLKDGNPKPYILLISGGTNDGTVGNYPEQYHNILKTNNVDHVWHSITGTGHDGSSVQPHLYNFIRHIFNVE